MSRIAAHAGLAVVLVFLAGCDTPPPPRPPPEDAGPGTVQLMATLPPTPPGYITRVTATLFSEGQAPRVLDLTATPEGWTEELVGLPALGAYTVVAQGFDAAHVLHYESDDEHFTFPARGTQTKPIPLRDRGGHPIPEITRASQSSPTAEPGQTLTFEVEARDPLATPLALSWTANVGEVSEDRTRNTFTWTAPACVATTATPSVLVTVTNFFGATATRSFPVAGLPTCGPGRWTPTGTLLTARDNHTATLLATGQVLVAGGYRQGATSPQDRYLASAELYDPATGTWSATGSLRFARATHEAVRLADGRVLVVGGWATHGTIERSAELYDPATGTWSPTGSTHYPRRGHTLTPLRDGRVFLEGVEGGSSTSEVYSPATGTWSKAGTPPGSRRRAHAAAPLPDGTVLVTGGAVGLQDYLSVTEVYDPVTDTFRDAADLREARAYLTATSLFDGSVLVTGGERGGTLVERYEPAADAWRLEGALSTPRARHRAARLSTGVVLVAGGNTPDALKTAELYDPATGQWSPTVPMNSGRDDFTMTPLLDGRVLVMGNNGRNSTSDTPELYEQAPRP
ncbi:Kelch repeat-containing protein [Archangium primigenium]|uniref:Kelch repeat-containing protein n=1 Tax=[Archangium] primigenium TaxID=2792470 RepID=UPI0019577E75|nr:kelch repeat-containing protein [Archangium primigenium]MBM7113325.1 hypothetical protein [Archangium primigenium]